MDYKMLEEKLLLVSHRMLTVDTQGQQEKFPVSLLDIHAWEWPQGVGLLGLMRYYLSSKDESVLTFLEAWYAEHLPHMDAVERNVNSTCPMLTLTYLQEIAPKEEYMTLIRSWADWVMSPDGLIRTGDGCMQHMITGDANGDQLLIDTLFMAVLFLARAGRMLNRPDMVQEANYQVLAHIKYLFDPQSGLFFHGWSFKEMNNYGRVWWLRGNGWYTVAIIDFIAEQKQMPEEERRYMMATFIRQAEALLRYWDAEEGLWHTVIRRKDSYIEASGSAAVLCGIMKAVRLGYLPYAPYAECIRKGMKAMLGLIAEDGTVKKVSYGTPIGMNEQFYMDIPCFTMTYGQAMTILMLQEAMQSYWMNKL